MERGTSLDESNAEEMSIHLAIQQKDESTPIGFEIDTTRGIIKSERKTMVLLTIPPRGSPAAVDDSEHTEWVTLEATKPRVFNVPGFPKPVPKPNANAPVYEVRTTPEMGMGVFATRNIKAGELIFAERPLLVVPINANMLELNVQPTMGLYGQYEQILEASVSRMSEVNQVAFRALMNSHTEDGSGLLTGIVRTNGYGEESVYDGPGTKAADLASCYSFVGNVASRINHSCVGNVYRGFDKAAFAFTFKALVNIRAGEQLLHPYCETHASVARRRSQLDSYGFVCGCHVCANATPASDKFREVYTKRTSEFKARSWASVNGVDESWPNDRELKELEKFREITVKERLHNRPSYRHVLSALVLGYSKRGMFSKFQEVANAVKKNETLFEKLF
ncbi:SET domain-containing protein [Pholiota conissans]|uniref:SET domain-containing protein n=1 Tax=Pholiota conissans TaxID=109636 RepID=A0A9P6CVN6_9AGAR|nr:SET domain-containing protein [Pholiota conissans]